MIIRTLIIDHQPRGERQLHRLLAAEPDFSVVAECATAQDAARALETHGPDVVFLATGRSADDDLVSLADLPPDTRPLSVIVTSSPEGSFVAFELGAVDCLPLPIDPGRFQTALTRLRLRVNALQRAATPATDATTAPLKRFVVRSTDRLIVIDAAQVDWMESASNYVVLHVGRETHVLRDTLARIERRLPGARFIRVSRFAIVNLDRIREVILGADGNHLVLLAGGDKVPLTRGVREVQERLESV